MRIKKDNCTNNARKTKRKLLICRNKEANRGVQGEGKKGKMYKRVWKKNLSKKIITNSTQWRGKDPSIKRKEG